MNGEKKRKEAQEPLLPDSEDKKEVVSNWRALDDNYETRSKCSEGSVGSRSSYRSQMSDMEKYSSGRIRRHAKAK